MKNILIGILLFLFTSCVQERGNLNCYTLSVDLKNSSLQYSDVFSGAEVIPLETRGKVLGNILGCLLFQLIRIEM